MSAVDNSALKACLDDTDTKRFEIIAKHYYDLFAYHAAQRLTTFNFFIVSLSFLSNAYATLVAKGDDAHRDYYFMAAALASTAYLLVLLFGRLDKRNEQIIIINEAPLRRIQAVVAESFEGLGWETFDRSSTEATWLRTFGQLLPLIYILAAALAAGGACYALVLGAILDQPLALRAWLVLVAVGIVSVTVKGPRRGIFRRAREALFRARNEGGSADIPTTTNSARAQGPQAGAGGQS